MRKTLFVLLLVAVLIGSFVSCKEEPAHEHTWDEGKVTTPATCEKEGVKTYTCECGETKTEAIPATGEHTWNAGVVTTDPTETADGVKTYTCTVCGKKTTEAIPKTAICVSTFAELEQAFTDIKAEGETRKIICLTADIAWDATKYDGSDADHTFSIDMTGITLNLNKHTISGIANKAFAPTGNTFTIKNGSVLLATGLEATYLRAISVNFSETLTYADHTTEAEQAKAVTFDGITTNGCLYLGGGAFIIKDSTIESYGTKTRGICSYSAYVDVTNSTVKATNGEVAIHARDTVLNLNNGTTVISPTHGIQAYYKSTVTTTGTVTITAAGAGYDIYLNYGPNTLTIGSGTTISGATKGVFALTFGDTVTIANGATITGPAGGVEPKYTAAGYTKASGTASTNGYVGWSKGNNNTADTATITDNRVLE